MITTCRDSLAAIDDYLDATLPSVQRALLDFHLLGCAHCRDYFRMYRDTIKLANALREGAPESTEELASEILLRLSRTN
jgi:predicted anti-sigma-YlaC factor YlaD